MGNATKPTRAGKRPTADDLPLAPPWRNWESSWADIRARCIPAAAAALSALAELVERHRQLHPSDPRWIQPDPIGQWNHASGFAMDALYRPIIEPITVEATIRRGERERDIRRELRREWGGWAEYPGFRDRVIESMARLAECPPLERWRDAMNHAWFPLFRLGEEVIGNRGHSVVDGVVRSTMDGEVSRAWLEAHGAYRLCVRCQAVSDTSRPSTPARDQPRDYIEADAAVRIRACAAALLSQRDEQLAGGKQRVILWALSLEGGGPLGNDAIEPACKKHKIETVSSRTVSEHRSAMVAAGWVEDRGHGGMVITPKGESAKGTTMPLPTKNLVE